MPWFLYILLGCLLSLVAIPKIFSSQSETNVTPDNSPGILNKSQTQAQDNKGPNKYPSQDLSEPQDPCYIPKPNEAPLPPHTEKNNESPPPQRPELPKPNTSGFTQNRNSFDYFPNTPQEPPKLKGKSLKNSINHNLVKRAKEGFTKDQIFIKGTFKDDRLKLLSDILNQPKINQLSPEITSNLSAIIKEMKKAWAEFYGSPPFLNYEGEEISTKDFKNSIKKIVLKNTEPLTRNEQDYLNFYSTILIKCAKNIAKLQDTVYRLERIYKLILEGNLPVKDLERCVEALIQGKNYLDIYNRDIRKDLEKGTWILKGFEDLKEIIGTILDKAIAKQNNYELLIGPFINGVIDYQQQKIDPQFTQKPNLHGGDCAVYTVRDALETIKHAKGKISNDNIQSLRQEICAATQKFFPLYELAEKCRKKEDYNDWSNVAKWYKDIFKDFTLFKEIMPYYLLASKYDINTDTKTIVNREELVQQLEPLQTWKDLASNLQLLKQIFKTSTVLDVEISATLALHNLDQNATKEKYYDQASQAGFWLTTYEMSAYLFTLGFIRKSSKQIINSSNSYHVDITYEDVISKKQIFVRNSGIIVNSDHINPQGIGWEALILNNSAAISDVEKKIEDRFYSKQGIEGDQLQNTIEVINGGYSDWITRNGYKSKIKSLTGYYNGPTDHDLNQVVQAAVNDPEHTTVVPLIVSKKHTAALVIGANSIKYFYSGNNTIPPSLKQILENSNYPKVEEQQYSTAVSTEDPSISFHNYVLEQVNRTLLAEVPDIAENIH